MAGQRASRGTPESLWRSEIPKLIIIAVFALISLFITLYAFTADIITVENYPLFPHLYLIPIILVTLWYPKRGLQVTGLIVAAIIFLSIIMYYEGILITSGILFLYAGMDLMIFISLALYAKDRHLVNALLRELFERQWDAGKGIPVAESRSPEDLSEVLRSLNSPDEEEREEAARALCELKDPRGVDPLLTALRDKSRYVRREAAKALGSIGEVRAIPAVLETLKDEDQSVREGAAEGLALFGKKAVEPLLAAIEDPDWHVRVGCVIAFRIIGDRRAIDAIVNSLHDENRFVRREAVKTLGRIGESSAYDPLVDALSDEDRSVRIRAISALVKCCGTGAADPIRMALDDPDSSVRLRAARALDDLRISRGQETGSEG